MQLLQRILTIAVAQLPPPMTAIFSGVSIWQSYTFSSKAPRCNCLDPRIIKNDPSTLGEEPDGFVSHRNDQSILTNLAIREGLTVAGPEYRNFIECDYDYWYERGSRGYGREIDQFLMSIKDA